jgi:hypothetical protein
LIDCRVTRKWKCVCCEFERNREAIGTVSDFAGREQRREIEGENRRLAMRASTDAGEKSGGVRRW